MFKPLSKKESKRVIKKLKEHYGFSEDLPYLFYKKDDEIYISSKELKNIKDFKSKGLLFVKKDLILSIEGSQMIKAKKNVLEISSEEKKKWLRGLDLNSKKDGVFVVKSGEDYLGSGVAKKGKLINSLEKKRLMLKV